MTLKRRNFLKGVLGLSAVGILHLPALAAPSKPVGPDHFAFLTDIHIRKKPIRGVQTAEHFAKNIEQILAAPELPMAAVIFGDCACLTGKPDDYILLAKSLEPLRKAGVPVYLLLGNHDDRDALWNAFPEQKGKDAGAFEDPKHIKVISTPNVNLFLLDSKVTGNFSLGRMGKDQLEWLDKQLQEHKDKPAVLIAHHDPAGNKIALYDYSKFYAVLKRHPQAKGYFFGHKHEWYQQQNEKEKLWEVCFPASAYVFNEKEPLGWVDAQFLPQGVKLTLNTMDKKDPRRGEVVELAWEKK